MTNLFTREAIADWMWRKERALLDELAEITQLPAFKNSLYGRNGRARGTEFGQCDDSATWSITGYGSDQAIVDMCERHMHLGAFEWLMRKVKYAADIVPWWIERFGKPPGEDAWLEPCHDRTTLVAANHGDTDIQRHWDSFGLHRAGLLGMKYGFVEEKHVVGLATSLLTWLKSGISKTTQTEREYIRYGNRINSLCGIWEALNRPGYLSLARDAWATLKALVYYAYDPKNILHVKNDEGEDWPIYSYGGFRKDGETWKPAFPYGWWPHGNQAWYVGHNLIGLWHAWERAVWQGDHEFAAFVAGVVDKQTKWLDVKERDESPAARADDEKPFSNSLMQGLLTNKAPDPFLTFASHVCQHTPSTLRNLDPSDKFYRATFINHHEADDKAYHSKTIKDPDGVEHDRTAFRYKAGYTGRPNLDIINAYGCTEGLFMRAMLYPTEERIDWAYIVPMTMMGWGHVSDTLVRVDKMIDPDDGVRGYNLIGGFNRPYHWWIQTGMNMRKHFVSNGKPTARRGGDLDALRQMAEDVRAKEADRAT